MKQSRFMERLADTVASHPRTLLASIALVSAFLAFQLPHLSADPSPRALLASADPEQEKLEAEARGYFGSTDNVVVIVLSGQDVLAQPSLEYERKLASALLAMPHVERVDALTRVVWPKRVEEQGTLDDLDSAADADEASPNALGAAADLVAARPDVFPNGVASLSEKTAGQKLEPLVAGEHVTAADVASIRGAVEQAKQLSGRLISRDRKHLAVAVSFSDAVILHSEVEALVQGIERWLLDHPAPDQIKISLSGLPVVRSSLVRHMRKDQRILIPGTLIASFIVLALSFRWWPAVVLPVVAVAVTALWLLGGMALVNERLNVLNNMLPALVIIIGLNEAVHIIGRYIEEHTRLADKRAALHETIRAMGAACLMTTLTSAIGMAALLVSRTEMLRRFGLVGAIGLLLAYAVTLLVVPAALSLLPAPPKQAQSVDEQERGLIEAWMSRATASAMRHPWAVVIVAALFTALAGYESGRVVVDSNMLGQFGKNDPVRLSTQLLEDQFEGVRPLEVTLSSEIKGRFFQPDVLLMADRIAGWASQQKGVLRVTSPSEPLSSVWTAVSGRPLDPRDALQNREQVEALAEILHERDPRILGPVLTADGTRARVRVKLSDIGSKATTTLVAKLREELDRELKKVPNIKVSFGGDAYVSSRGLSAVVSDLSGSVAAAAVMIFLLLAVLLGDFRLALLAVPANLLPQVWTMAWMVMRDIPLNASSAIIFSLSIGLAVDGSIHLISRYQEERARSGLVTVALVRAVRGTGRNIVISSAALVLGFSVMLLSSFVPVQRFAELITVSMAGCVIATLIIQPVLIRFFAVRTRSPKVVPGLAKS